MMVQYGKMSYKEVLEQMEESSISFDCELSSTFLLSLASDVYHKLVKVSSLNKSKKVRDDVMSNECTEDIYIESRDVYGKISFSEYAPKMYNVHVDIRPAGFKRKDVSDGVFNAAALMSG